MVQNQIIVSCLTNCYLTVGFCILDIVYCEAVRSAILATVWLLVRISCHSLFRLREIAQLPQTTVTV